MHFQTPLITFALTLSLTPLITAHTAAWAPGMYCRNGSNPAINDQNTNLAVNPLYDLEKKDWWFQHDRGCDAAPPNPGDFLELPANGEFTVELAHNRAFTTLSYEGRMATDWPDGGQHPENWNGWNTDGTAAVCLKEDGALHTYNETSAGGTAFAISYNSKMEDVTMENLVVFTTLDHTPWKRKATYKVPDLAACPEEGCHCAWLWIPNGCGQANMYMQGFKCKVTNAKSTKKLAKAQVPVYCEDDQSKCIKGAKQMLAWHQKTGNNIETKEWVTPNYNKKCGWAEGAQTDIFEAQQAPVPVSTLVTKASSSIATATATPTPTKQAVITSSSVVAPKPSSTSSTSSKKCTKTRTHRYARPTCRV